MKQTLLIAILCIIGTTTFSQTPLGSRQKILFNDGWRFFKYDSNTTPDDLIYDERPPVHDAKDDKDADSKPTEAETVTRTKQILKPWILPTGNDFINDVSKHYHRPANNPGKDFPFVQHTFDDSQWKLVRLPHDWAIEGPFYEDSNPLVGGGMGRLPSPGVAWYRNTLSLSASDKGKKIYLDIDGAMSYAMVWVNGILVGGWPYGYASWQVELTPYVHYNKPNQIAIRIDNPNHSARWYPGGGLYRNVWITKTSPIHVAQWGTFITTHNVSSASATISLDVTLVNKSFKKATIQSSTHIYAIDANGKRSKEAVAAFSPTQHLLPPNGKATSKHETKLANPALWGPYPSQTPNRYVAITTIKRNNNVIDEYETTFGIRDIVMDGKKGLFVNGEHVFLKGANQHHDLGALGAAFNVRAAERQLEILREAGCNAIRLAHNPPAPELLELTDRMGFLVINEIFDSWERKKTPHDFHLIFSEWHEQDMRAFIRRDRNHPSVIMWSFGNEVGEQYTDQEGADIGHRLVKILKEEDDTRPTSASMNYAKPTMPFPKTMDVINLNYQGEGIRDAEAYQHLQGIRTSPMFPAFHEAFPEKMIVSSENAAAVSLRGEYLFPVIEGSSAPVSDGIGGDSKNQIVSSYELYTVPFGASADKVFASEDKHPYVAGGFVWSGWDYIGEPTPYYGTRSTYFGIIDLAGFKKDRFYLYQSRWRPELPMVHILPHWNWPERIGQFTPVHVFTSGDEVELFLNDVSQGRKKKGPYEYRLRWDNIIYAPGTLRAIAYKDEKVWSEETIATTSEATALYLTADRTTIKNDGYDLAFITVEVKDREGRTVPRANTEITFEVEGPGEIVATDNGDPRDFTSFASTTRKTFNGLCLVIVRIKPGEKEVIKIRANADGFKTSQLEITPLVD